MLNKFRDVYLTKYFELYNKSLKGDSPKDSDKNINKNISNLKFKKYNKRSKAFYRNGNFNNINNNVEKQYQNDKHMKKNILKKKKLIQIK